jgi:tetratricopeptide (TPR) repeat protein
MQEEQQTTQGRGSAIARMLMGKVLSHKIFSDRALFFILLGTTFVLPLFFIPGDIIAPEFAKMILLEGVVFISIIIWALSRLRDGHLDIPKSLLLLVGGLLVVQFIVAAFMSPTPMLSFVGSGYDIGTVNSFITLFLLLFVVSLVFTDRDRTLMLYASFMLSGVLVMVYHLLRYFFGADFLSFGIFTNAVGSPIGKWNDMAALFGAMMILVLTTLYFFPQNKIIRAPSYTILTIGLFFLLLVDFTMLWRILFGLTGMLVAFAIYEGEKDHKTTAERIRSEGGTHAHKPLHRRVAHHLPWFATLLLIVSIVYGAGLSSVTWGKDGTTIASLVSKTLHAEPYSEVVLTPSYTYNIVTSSIKDSPLFGTGPNRFSSAYLTHKTTDMNRTPFWDASFDYGVGRIPTYFITTGLLGTILWLIFIALIFTKSRRVLTLFAKDRIAAYLAFSLFVLVIYFWSLAFFYLPNITIFGLAFLFTGALIAFFVGEGVLQKYHLQFDGKNKLSMIVTPVIIIVIVGIIASSALLYRQVSSLIAFRDAQMSMGKGEIETAEVALRKAVALSERDIYHRALSNLALLKLQGLPEKKLSQEELARYANEYVGQARDGAERAVALDPTNFENHLQLGGVYDTLGSMGIQNTAEPARTSYEQALRLNPKSPRVLFVLARLEFASGDRNKCKEYLRAALAERPNFLEAISFLVQLEIEDKNTPIALGILQNGVGAEPDNFLLRFALGYMYYSNGSYKEAAGNFEAAVFLNPVYADAKYFLGLSYSKLGLKDQATEQFKDVLTLNPENKEVQKIISNIKAGREPLQGEPAAPSQPVSDALKGLEAAKGTKEAGE